MCDAGCATHEDDNKPTCQFCQAEFNTIEDLCKHVKDCKTAKKCGEVKRGY